jgi:hypothetical protein
MDRFAQAFDGMALECNEGVTTLTGSAMDQGRLFGILDDVRNLGLELLTIEEFRPLS